MMDKMPVRIKDDMFSRDYALEKEYGVSDLKLYGYWERENSMYILGQIISSHINKEFCLVCTLYDEDGDVIESIKNETYGGFGFVTHSIKPETFFDGFPFRFEVYGTERSKVKEIQIVLSD